MISSGNIKESELSVCKRYLKKGSYLFRCRVECSLCRMIRTYLAAEFGSFSRIPRGSSLLEY